ncbi:Six-hairpin glycosidase-like protein [Mycena latifolia]|nr:Six-hairpin glycosidase-like protein [Mycena latifolia]
MDLNLPELFAESNATKLWAVATRLNPAEGYPEYTTVGGPNTYECSHKEFWTSGFFPGSLWLLRQRAALQNSISVGPIGVDEWEKDMQRWCDPLKSVCATLTDTHDLGFLCLPFQHQYALHQTPEAKEVLLAAASNLAARFDVRVGTIRSWDTCITKRYAFGPERFETDFLTIIDNMMNLNLLYEATAFSGDARYAQVASTHAETMQRNHIRADGGTPHVVNYNPATGAVQDRFANQGFSDTSTWARGQAWGIYGFANAALRTSRADFLSTAIRLTDYFLSRLPEDGVPHWDFDCPRPTFRDSSAATCAANGLLMIHLALTSTAFADHPHSRDARYFTAAVELIRDTIDMCLTPAARFVPDADGAGLTDDGTGKVELGEGGWETILQHATVNNYEFAPRRWADHGLVYGDYYFIEFGNRLLQMEKEGIELEYIHGRLLPVKGAIRASRE